MCDISEVIIVVVSIVLLWERPRILTEFGKTYFGIAVLLAILMITAYISPSLTLLVGATIIAIIKEGCTSELHNLSKQIFNNRLHVAKNMLPNKEIVLSNVNKPSNKSYCNKQMNSFDIFDMEQQLKLPICTRMYTD